MKPQLNQVFAELEGKLEKALAEVPKQENQIKNTTRPKEGSWTQRITSKIRISDLARENGIDECPNCSHYIRFDDFKGTFICSYSAWTKKEKCDFFGNIVDFQMFIMEGRR